MKIRGYRQGQAGGGCLVTVVDGAGDEMPIPLPSILVGREFRHSPDGFQWGYQGSGPAELARAILVTVIKEDDRVRHPRCYQQFKMDVISRIRVDEFTMDEMQVREWYDAFLMRHGLDIDKDWLAG